MPHIINGWGSLLSTITDKTLGSAGKAERRIGNKSFSGCFERGYAFCGINGLQLFSDTNKIYRVNLPTIAGVKQMSNNNGFRRIARVLVVFVIVLSILYFVNREAFNII